MQEATWYFMRGLKPSLAAAQVPAQLMDFPLSPCGLTTTPHARGHRHTHSHTRFCMSWYTDLGIQRRPFHTHTVQFSSVAQSCLTLCDPMNCSMPGLPVHHQLPEFPRTHVHWVSDAIQPSHPLSSPSPLAPNPSQHQSLFQWVNSSHQVAKVLEFQL